MENELESKSDGNGINVKTFIPCKVVYPYAEQGGVPQYNTCVEVFRYLTFFDFPSLPRNIYSLLMIEALKGSYEIGMNIVDESGNKLIAENIKKIDEIRKEIEKKQISVPLVSTQNHDFD